MRLLKTFFICLFTALAMLALAMLAQAPAARTKDEVAVREIVNKYVAAREQSDAQAIAALFTGDADQLVSSGEWRKGREDVVRGTLASSQSAAGKRTIAVESIRFIARDAALADGRYEIAGPAGGQSRRMWTTLVLSRTPDGWRIAAIRNMLPAPPAGASAGR
jgi:uncharacterized protein (TIGR02246 family)